MAVYVASLNTSSPISSDEDGAEIAAAGEVPMTDEQGRFWGNVTEEQAERIGRAERELGMKLSAAIPAISGLKEPQASVQVAQNTPADFPIVGAADMAQQGQPAKGYNFDKPPYGTVWNRDRTKGTVFDENRVAWGDVSPDIAMLIDAATDNGMKRSEAIPKFSQYGVPGRSHEWVAEQERIKAEQLAEVADMERKAQERVAAAKADEERREAKIAADRKAAIAAREETARQIEAARLAEAAEAKRQAEEAALLGSASAVDQSATTSSVTESAPAVVETKTVLDNADAKTADPVQPAKKKPALDL
jgi:hypothetical protein